MKPAPQVPVRLPAALVRLFPGAQPQVELTAATIGELVDALDACWPGMRDRLCDSRPRLRRNINVYVAGKRADLATPLAPGAQVVVMLAITG